MAWEDRCRAATARAVRAEAERDALLAELAVARRAVAFERRMADLSAECTEVYTSRLDAILELATAWLDNQHESALARDVIHAVGARGDPVAAEEEPKG